MAGSSTRLSRDDLLGELDVVIFVDREAVILTHALLAGVREDEDALAVRSDVDDAEVSVLEAEEGRERLLVGNIHVDALKAQHHLSEHNIDEELCRRVTARHYVMCGNGEHVNPDVDALDAILNSRLGVGDARSPNAEAGDFFTPWFNSSETETTNAEAYDHMRKFRKRVDDTLAAHPGRFDAHFLQGAAFQLIEL